MKNILFIHHGHHRAGAPLSMLYTMIEIRKHGYNPIAGLTMPSKELKQLYQSHYFQTIDLPQIEMLYFWSANRMQWWKHSTYKAFLNLFIHHKKGLESLQQAIDQYNIHLVHLNSVSLMALVPYLQRQKIRYVWHIREHAPEFRSPMLHWVRKLMLKTSNIIFLSKTEQYSWLKTNSHGTVMYNFVHREKFDHSIKPNSLRKKLGLTPQNLVLLYLGGVKHHKGITILVEALQQLTQELPEIRCVMLDSAFPKDGKTKITPLKRYISKLYNSEYIDLESHINDRIKTLNLEKYCIRLPFETEVQSYFSIADVVVFPATSPHFARPVIEAALMKKPVVVTDWPVLREIMVPEVTGLTVKPKNVGDLAEKLKRILNDKPLAKKMGNEGYKFSIHKFTPNYQIPKLIEIYNRVIENNSYLDKH